MIIKPTPLQTYYFGVNPIPKGRGRHGHRGVYTPQRTRDYEGTIARLAQAQNPDGIIGHPIGLIVDFRVESDIADIDNLLKSLFDGMQKGDVYKNDKLIKWVLARKRKAEGAGNTGIKVFTDAEYDSLFR